MQGKARQFSHLCYYNEEATNVWTPDAPDGGTVTGAKEIRICDRLARNWWPRFLAGNRQNPWSYMKSMKYSRVTEQVSQNSDTWLLWRENKGVKVQRFALSLQCHALELTSTLRTLGILCRNYWWRNSGNRTPLSNWCHVILRRYWVQISTRRPVACFLSDFPAKQRKNVLN